MDYERICETCLHVCSSESEYMHHECFDYEKLDREIAAAVGWASSSKICERCRRVCFSEAEFLQHICFDMDAKIDAEILAIQIAAAIRGHVFFWPYFGSGKGGKP